MSKTAIDTAELERRASHRKDYFLYDIATDKAGVTAKRIVQHPLEVWFQRNVIDRRRYDAGMKLLELYEAGDIYSMSRWDGTPLENVYLSRTPGVRAMEALAEYDRAHKAMPAAIWSVLAWFCCHGQSPDTNGRKGQRLVGEIKLSLETLADHWGM